jgi:cell division protease FtsH
MNNTFQIEAKPCKSIKAQAQVTKPSSSRSKQRNVTKFLFYVATVCTVLQSIILVAPASANAKPDDRNLSYSQLLEKIKQNQVEDVEIDRTTNTARVKLVGQDKNEPPKQTRLFDQNPELIELLRDRNIEFDIRSSPDRSTAVGLAVNLLLVVLLLTGLLMILRRSANVSGQALSFGKSRARFQM